MSAATIASRLTSPLRTSRSRENQARRGNFVFSPSFIPSPLRNATTPSSRMGLRCRTSTSKLVTTPGVLRSLQNELDDICSDLDAYIISPDKGSDAGGECGEQGASDPNAVERVAHSSYVAKLGSARELDGHLARMGGDASSSPTLRSSSSSSSTTTTTITSAACRAASRPRLSAAASSAAIAEEMLALLRERFSLKSAELAWTLRNCCRRLVRISEATDEGGVTSTAAQPIYVRRQRFTEVCSALVGALHFAASVSADGVHVAGRLQAAACEAICAHASEASCDFEHPAADMLIDAGALPALVYVLRSEAGQTLVLRGESPTRGGADAGASTRAACSFAAEALQLLLLNSTRGEQPLLRCGALAALCSLAAAPFRDADLTTRTLEALMWAVRCAMERPRVGARGGSRGAAQLDLAAVATAACADQVHVGSARARIAACDLMHAVAELACRWTVAARSSDGDAALLIRAAAAASALLMHGGRQVAEAAAAEGAAAIGTTMSPGSSARLRQSARRALSSLRRLERTTLAPCAVMHGGGAWPPRSAAAHSEDSATNADDVGCVQSLGGIVVDLGVGGCAVM